MDVGTRRISPAQGPKLGLFSDAHFGSLWITLANPWHRFGLLVSQCFTNFTRLRELPVIAIPLSAQKAWSKKSKPATSQSCHRSTSACHSLSQLLISFCKRPVKKMLRWHTVCHTVSWYVLVTSLVGTSGASMRLISVIASCFLAVFFPSTILLWFQDRVAWWAELDCSWLCRKCKGS
jgi:hypothetical protein